MGKAYGIAKRVFDITGSVVLIAAAIPVSLAAAVMIKAESPGPVLFVHKRVGLNGRSINIYKFRSMREGSEDIEAVLNDEETERYYQEYKLKDDPRINRTGMFLRKTSLDELPQLINIIQGRMSLTGPRPVTNGELDFYTDDERRLLLSVRPGLTGLWQISDRNEATYQSGKRQETELWYVKHASPLLDIKILLKTPAAVIRRSRTEVTTICHSEERSDEGSYCNNV